MFFLIKNHELILNSIQQSYADMIHSVMNNN